MDTPGPQPTIDPFALTTDGMPAKEYSQARAEELSQKAILNIGRYIEQRKEGIHACHMDLERLEDIVLQVGLASDEEDFAQVVASLRVVLQCGAAEMDTAPWPGAPAVIEARQFVDIMATRSARPSLACKAILKYPQRRGVLQCRADVSGCF